MCTSVWMTRMRMRTMASVPLGTGGGPARRHPAWNDQGNLAFELFHRRADQQLFEDEVLDLHLGDLPDQVLNQAVLELPDELAWQLAPEIAAKELRAGPIDAPPRGRAYAGTNAPRHGGPGRNQREGEAQLRREHLSLELGARHDDLRIDQCTRRAQAYLGFVIVVASGQDPGGNGEWLGEQRQQY